jgi:hypothetical protein
MVANVEAGQVPVADRAPGRDLGRCLVSAPERWGWEYVDPGPVVPSPESQRAPVWEEPPPPDLTRYKELAARLRAKQGAPASVLASLGLTVVFFVLLFTQPVLAVLMAVALCGLAAVPSVLTARAKGAHARGRDQLYAQWERELAAWRARVEAHDRLEEQRRSEALLWYPLSLWSAPGRIDVVGGTHDGWASLLATAGCSLLGASDGVVLADFTERGIGRELAQFAEAEEIGVRRLELPAGAPVSALIGDLPADDVAELVSGAIRALRDTSESRDLHALDTEVLGVAAARLASPITFRRLAAAIGVLRRVYDEAEGVLTTAELAALSGYIDRVGQSERTRHEVEFVSGALDLLARLEIGNGTGGGCAGWWPATGLTIIATADGHRRRKDLLDALVLHRLLLDLRTRSAAAHAQTLIVAGADHLGQGSLEALAAQARRADVRLVLLLERLRGEVESLFGSAASAALVMRLGNAKDAAAAAEFVGRGHRFALSQITRQIGVTLTHGTAQSDGGQVSESETSGVSVSAGYRHASVSSSYSASFSRSRTWQSTVNESQAQSATDGTTLGRSYEFIVEPTTIQALPATAYILVEAGPAGRRVCLGDCNPGIALLDRVAEHARTP